MRKITFITLFACAAIMSAIAGSVYDRKTVALSASGSVTTQLDYAYSGIKLQRVWLLDSAAAQTVTLKRVDTSGVYTQTVCTVDSTNSTATFTAQYVLPSDTLITSGGTTNGTLQLEFEVQKH